MGNKKDGLCTVCGGKGFINYNTAKLNLSLCMFCNGTGNAVVIKSEKTPKENHDPSGERPTVKKYNGTNWESYKLYADEYQHLAARTIDNMLGHRDKIDHALFGMAGEVGEIHSIHQKAYQGHPISPEDAKSEVGDLLWFIAEYCTACGWNLSDIMIGNIKKLQERYPNGFESERSVHRKEYFVPKKITYYNK